VSLLESVAVAEKVTWSPGLTAVAAAPPTVAVGPAVTAGAVLPGVTSRVAATEGVPQLSVTTRLTVCATWSSKVC
jgi:hypothetical protein